MTETANQLIASVLQLTLAERALIANAILASIETPLDSYKNDEILDAWAEEIDNRIADLESGRVKAIFSADAWKIIDGEAELPN